ncbi:hypothetical protein [Roseinatronobacter thiooxidans]|nr:hypothetical protein [Roseinatronobacter thiooxidans]
MLIDAIIFRGVTDLTVPDQLNTSIYAMRSRLGDAGNGQRGTFTAE